MTLGRTVAGLGLAMAVAWLGYRGLDAASVPRDDRVASVVPARVDPPATAGAPSVRASAVRPGFPTMEADAEHRTWRAMVDREIGETAAIAAGDAWTAEARERFFGALARLRDAAARRERLRGAPDSDEAIGAARRHRSAAFEADALSRELFGIPLAALVQRADPGGIEEVPPG